jgi:hypothetical protein
VRRGKVKKVKKKEKTSKQLKKQTNKKTITKKQCQRNKQGEIVY